ncbi:hypothetical protein JHK82_027575 [Glycine max]|nr:hypothetical protein JHK82_027575 [Glycine max]
MSPSNKEDMPVLYKFPRALHSKTLVDIPFSETLRVDSGHEHPLFQDPCRHAFLTLLFFPFSCNMAKYDYQSIKRKKVVNVEVAEDWAPPPPINTESDERKDLSFSSQDVTRKKQRVATPSSIIAPSPIESHSMFLSMKEGEYSHWGKDFNPCALICALFLATWTRHAKGEEPLKDDLKKVIDSAQTFQDGLNVLIKSLHFSRLMLQQLKTDLGEAEAEILRTHEASFKKALHQVKFFLKDVDISFFDVDKDIDHQGELVNEA